jgi:esterase/lipase superfamily enzyme
MNREYHKWWSPRLHRDMELLVFGHGGAAALIFPSSMGSFHEFEDTGMVGSLAHKLQNGWLQLYCIDSVDKETFYNRHVHPRDRLGRHVAYEHYIIFEVLPLIRSRNPSGFLTAAGCSFGGYHAVNFSLRHPDVVNKCLSMSGAFDIRSFMHGFYDDSVYFNNPVDYLPNANDPWFLERYRRMHFILATGEHDHCWNDNERLAGIMRAKHIPHQLDVWGNGTGHEWKWWRQMAPVYL